MNKVSIVMPLYEIDLNMLKESINSILNQTYSDYELIIVCDKTTKELDIVLDNYANKDDRIKIIRNPYRFGIAKSLNCGIQHSNGIYIARMDGDDISLPERLHKQVKYLEAHKDIDVLFTRSGLINYCGKRINHKLSHFLSDTEIISSLFVGNMLYHATVMIRKSTLQNCNCFYNENYKIEDYDLWTRLAIAGAKFHQLKDNLYLYRIHENQLTLKVKDSVVKEKIEILYKFIIDDGIETTIDEVKSFNAIMTSIGSINADDYSIGKKLLKRIICDGKLKVDANYFKRRLLFMKARRFINNF